MEISNHCDSKPAERFLLTNKENMMAAKIKKRITNSQMFELSCWLKSVVEGEIAFELPSDTPTLSKTASEALGFEVSRSSIKTAAGYAKLKWSDLIDSGGGTPVSAMHTRLTDALKRIEVLEKKVEKLIKDLQ